MTAMALAAAAEAAQDDYRRMSSLRRMGAGELHRLLSGPPETAAPWVETAARFGLRAAQLRLGQMHLDGAGVDRDETAALAWFLRAARKGAPDAMNMVGRCHENGWGTPVDEPAAADWYRRSAEAGHDWGEYNYANMLFDGRGVRPDRRQAAAFYRRAAEQGHARAMNLLARCHEEGWGVPQDRHEAWKWYHRSAQGGYFRAQFNYAMVLAGQGHIDRALDWFEQACRAATPDSLPGMIVRLISQPDRRLAALGRRFAGVA